MSEVEKVSWIAITNGLDRIAQTSTDPSASLTVWESLVVSMEAAVY